MHKNHQDPIELDLTKSRFASYKQKKWKRHQDTVYWVDIQLAQRKGLKFYQTRCNAIILYDTLSAYRIPKFVVMETGEIIHEKVKASPRPPPEIQKCIEMDELAKEDHTYHLSPEEFRIYQGQWYLTLNKSGKNAPMRLRPLFRAVVSLKNRLHRESSEELAEPNSPQGGTRLTGVGGARKIFVK